MVEITCRRIGTNNSLKLPGKENTAADALSRLDADFGEESPDEEIELTTEWEVCDISVSNTEQQCPAYYLTIEKAQAQELTPQQKTRLRRKHFGRSNLHVDKNNTIAVPASLKTSVLECCHYALTHPGSHRMERTTMLHFNCGRISEEMFIFLQIL
jgi:hypothetical protein